MGKGFLTVEAVWFLAKHTATNPKAAHAAYMKEALQSKFAQISLIDRKDLLDYLTGKVETSANVDITAPAFSVPEDVAAAVGEKRRRAEGEPTTEDAAGASRDHLEDGGRIRHLEMPLHTRNSVLQCNKDFSSVLRFFGQSKEGGKGGAHRGTHHRAGDGRGAADVGGAGGVAGGRAAPSKEAQNTAAHVVPLRTNRFGDVKNDEFYKDAVGKDFVDLGIDPNASFLDTKRSASLPQMSTEEAARLRGIGQEAAAAGARGGRPRPGTGPVGGHRKDPSAGAMPLIIVPAGYGSKVLFNMYNVAEFLANEKFVTWDACHKSGQKKHSNIVFKRRYKRDRSVKYEVTDKAPHKRSEDWARVVAVFVSGKEWQFKDWPFRGADDGDLVDTFQKVRGFYATYDTEPPAEIIKTWNVKVLRFQKNVRHGDRAQLEAFWSEVDKHLEIRQSRLAY